MVHRISVLSQYVGIFGEESLCFLAIGVNIKSLSMAPFNVYHGDFTVVLSSTFLDLNILDFLDTSWISTLEDLNIRVTRWFSQWDSINTDCLIYGIVNEKYTFQGNWRFVPSNLYV